MITPKRAAKICTRLGWVTTERKLTDWKQKGIIPVSDERGRGQAQGKIYYWENGTGIITHILAAEGLMNWRSRTKDVRLMLWFNGFEIRAKWVKEIWLSILEGRNQFLKRKYLDPFDLEDLIDRYFIRLNKNKTVSEKATSDLLGIFSKIIFSHQFEIPEEQALFKHALMDIEMFGADSSFSKYVLNGLAFLKTYFSPESRVQLLRSVSDDVLEQAQSDWGTVLRLIEPLLRAVQPKDANAWPDLRGAQLWWQLISNVGGNAILLDLALRQAGFSSRIDDSIAHLRNYKKGDALAREIRASVTTETFSRKGQVLFHRLFSELSDIWGNND